MASVLLRPVRAATEGGEDKLGSLGAGHGLIDLLLKVREVVGLVGERAQAERGNALLQFQNS